MGLKNGCMIWTCCGEGGSRRACRLAQMLHLQDTDKRWAGQVMLAKWRHTNVAVKILREVEDSESQSLDFKREAQLLK